VKADVFGDVSGTGPVWEPETGEYFLHAGWLIDGSGGPLRRNVKLAVRGGAIDSLEDAGRPADGAAGALDFSGCTVVPGFVDCHVHLFMCGNPDPVVRSEQLHAGFDAIAPVIERHLQAQLRSGVVAVRDAGDYGAHGLRYKREILDGSGPPIRMVSAGRGWHSPGRYGTFVGRAPSGGLDLHGAVAAGNGGADVLKIVNSGVNSLKTYGKETPPQFRADELRRAVAAAAAKGMKTMVHANGVAPVRDAIRAGCHSIEHGYFMGRENLARMAEAGVTWVPTVIPMRVLDEVLEPGSAEAEVARRTVDGQFEAIHLARELGVSIGVGTDCGSIGVRHGRAFVRELHLLLEAGMSVPEVVRCATWNGAALLGLGERLGMVRPSMDATFLVLGGAPEALAETAGAPRAVFVRGRRLDVS
jgi:imidazolonepropionase-like amidohydrolase